MPLYSSSKSASNLPSSVVCYILESDRGLFYCGITKNLAQRVQQHNRGQSKSTRSKGYWFIKWVMKFNSYREARFVEKMIKGSGVRHWYKKNIQYHK